jgi:hypothetical protein
MEKILIIDGDNYASRLFFTNKVLKNNDINTVNVKETMKSILPIFSRLKNRL